MSTEWYNRGTFNPASIARTEYMYLFTNGRHQWNGVSGAPKVYTLQASTYFNQLNSAFGISLVSDNVGISNAVNPMLNYAYRISDNENWQMSFGLAAGVFSRTIDRSLYDPENTSDPVLLDEPDNILKPDANAGVEFQNKFLIAGISSTHLFSMFKKDSMYLNSNHRYGYLIYKNTGSELFNFYTGVQVTNRNSLTYYDINASIRLKHPTGLSKGPREIIDFGVTYRTTKQITLLIGVNLSENLRVGYAYDQSFITGYSQNGTNELMLEYRIPLKSASTCITCRDENNGWYR